MSLLPQRIPPATEPLGHLDEDGKTVILEKNYWLFFYNLALQVLGATGAGLPPSTLIEIAAADSDVADADAIALRQPLANAAVQSPADLGPTAYELPDIARALLLAQDAFLPDPAPLAQPAAVISVGGSVFTWVAPANGVAAITGGTVSLIRIIRQTVTVATGLTAGLFPVSRLDQIAITHSGAPTMTFLPT